VANAKTLRGRKKESERAKKRNVSRLGAREEGNRIIRKERGQGKPRGEKREINGFTTKNRKTSQLGEGIVWLMGGTMYTFKELAEERGGTTGEKTGKVMCRRTTGTGGELTGKCRLGPKLDSKVRRVHSGEEHSRTESRK